MTTEEFKNKAELTNPDILANLGISKEGKSGYIEKYNLYSYKGLEYHECIYSHMIQEYYIYYGKEVSYEQFKSLLKRLN